MDVIFTGILNGKIENAEPHVHECCEIIIILEGSCCMCLDDEEFFLEENSVVIVPPGVVHGSLSEEGFRDLFIRVNLFPSVQDVPFVYRDSTGVVRYMGHLIHTTWIQKEFNYRAITSSLLSVISDYIIKFQNKGDGYDFVNKLKENIAQHFSESDFNLAKMNLSLGVSKDYLRHCFKKETGVTPLQYLMNMRIRQAKLYLIQNKHMSIEQIALDCGFKDGYYFSKCFKKKTGVSPSEFRNLNTKQNLNYMREEQDETKI